MSLETLRIAFILRQVYLQKSIKAVFLICEVCAGYSVVNILLLQYLVSRQRRDGMFILNIMRKTHYDEVTAQ